MPTPFAKKRINLLRRLDGPIIVNPYEEDELHDEMKSLQKRHVLKYSLVLFLRTCRFFSNYPNWANGYCFTTFLVTRWP